MNKNYRNILIGVAFGFCGMILYVVLLEGIEYMDLEELLDIIKQAIVPFIFTEILTAIFLEGAGNIRQSFTRFIERQRRKFHNKEVEEA